MKPCNIVKDAVPVIFFGIEHRDRGICPVIDDLARALVGTRLKIVDAHPSVSPDYLIRSDIESSEFAYCSVSDRIRRDYREELAVQPVICK